MAAWVAMGSQKAGEAGQALEEILKAVQDTVRQVGEIASSSQQMAGGARSVTDAMHTFSAVVEQSWPVPPGSSKLWLRASNSTTQPP